VPDERYVLQVPSADGTSLRCTFIKSGQRFVHTMDCIFDGNAVPQVSSVDGIVDDPWPPSPPWQELHVHEQPERSPALMLVGRAGKSHWSMTVTVAPEQIAFVFDVACRIREMPAFLGSTYRAQWSEQSGPAAQIEAIATGQAQTPPAHVDTVGEQIVVQAPCTVELPATVRWKYRIALECGESSPPPLSDG